MNALISVENARFRKTYKTNIRRLCLTYFFPKNQKVAAVYKT